MHPFILIPVIAIVLSAAFTAVAIAWESDRRATTSMSAVFICTGVWALLDVMTFLETDPARARFWIECMNLPALMLGPSVIWLLGHTFPQLGNRLERLAAFGSVVAVLLAVSVVVLPDATGEMVATSWGGWSARPRGFAIFVVPAGTILPLLAIHQVSRLDKRLVTTKHDARRAKAMTLAVCVSLLTAVVSEYVMPLLELSVPRLGAISIAALSGSLWLLILHGSDDLAVTPQGMARAMLAELHDGIALVQLDGTILATNRRFEEMTGRASEDLIGASLIEWVGPSADEICEGLEECESMLLGVEDQSLPVSLSSSVALGRNQEPIGAVVVFRDRREVDGLRRRLLASGRLAAIGELAAGIAHEVNNPVAFIRSDFNLLSRRLSEIKRQLESTPSEAQGLEVVDRIGGRIETALTGIERAAEVVSDVRGFAHAGGEGLGGNNPADLVEGAMRLARLQRGSEVDFRIENAEAGLDWIDSGQELKQVLLALLLIQVENLAEGGSVSACVASDRKHLQIRLLADPLVGDPRDLIARFESIEERTLDAAHAEFRTVVALELTQQLGAALSVSSPAPRALAIELDVPLEEAMTA